MNEFLNFLGGFGVGLLAWLLYYLVVYNTAYFISMGWHHAETNHKKTITSWDDSWFEALARALKK